MEFLYDYVYAEILHSIDYTKRRDVVFHKLASWEANHDPERVCVSLHTKVPSGFPSCFLLPLCSTESLYNPLYITKFRASSEQELCLSEVILMTR